MRKGRSSSWIQQQLGPRQHGEFNAGAEALGTKGRSPSPAASLPRGGAPARGWAPGASPAPSGQVPRGSSYLAPVRGPKCNTVEYRGRPGSRSRQPRAGAAASRAGHAGAPYGWPEGVRRQPGGEERPGRAGLDSRSRPSGPARPRRASPPRLSLCQLPASGHRHRGARGGSRRRGCRAGTDCPRLSGATLCPPHLGRPMQRRREPVLGRALPITVPGRALRAVRGLCGAAGARGRRRHLPPGPRAPRGAPGAPQLRYPGPVGGAGRSGGLNPDRSVG